MSAEDSDVELFSENEEEPDLKEEPNIFSDDEEEESDLERPVKKKQKRRPGNIFIEDQARVDDTDDEDDDEEAEDGFELNDVVEEDQNYSKARYRKLDLKRQEVEEEDAEKIAERLQQRYGRQDFRSYRGDVEHIPQSLLIPSVNDPKIWLAKCKPGSEKQIVMTILRKSFHLQNSTNPIQLLSCFYRDNLKGYIYLEAEKQAHVIHAIDRMNNIYATKLQLVPVNEMVDCLRVKQKETGIKLGMWVRVKRGKYGGDLAQVLDIVDSGDSVTVKLIPRLDYSRDASGKRKKSTTEIRQPQKLFNPADVNKREVTQQQGGYTFQSEYFDKDGYLEKSMKIVSLETKNVNPSLEEITKFSGGAVNDKGEDLTMLANANVAKEGDFQTGEKVIVLSGEMKNVPGTVHSVENGVVTIIPDKAYGLGNYVKYAANQLAKRFVEGDHAKVINGVHKDESGLVLKIENNVVTLLSDTSLKPLEVFSKDLRTANEVSSITATTSLYELFDLIQLSPSEVGVIIKMEKDVYTILDPFGNQLRIKPQQIQFKRDSTRAVTSDVNGRPVSQKDDVIVLDDTGINKKKATVLHVYRSSVYLQAKEIVDASGVFVTKSNNVSIISNKTSIPNQPIFAQPIGRPRGRDNLIDKTVTITGGAFKGYLGIVKDTTETTARVELHTHNRTITIDKTKLNVIGGQGSTSRPDYRSEGNRYGYEARTPMHGSGAKTPAHPADAWNSGSRTPAWNSGSKTPAWDSGSKTPAWDSGSKTPAWESGSRTPAWDSGSRTPARNRFPETPTAATPMDNPNTPYSTSTPAPYTPATTARYPSMNSVGPTPHTPYDHSTPMNPTTPAATDYLKEESRSSWITDGILVKIVSGKYSGQIGSCTMVDGAKGTISLSNGETSILMEDQLKPVLPQKRDSFKVLSGEYRGNIGNLLSIDGDEGVVKIEGNDEILMLQLNTLAKIIK